MPFQAEMSSSTRLVVAAGSLIAGELAGFAVRGLADVWAWVGFFTLTGFLAAYGWGLRRIFCATLFMLGVVLALRTDAELKRLMDENAGLHGPRPSLDISVEGGVNSRWNGKSGDGWCVDFLSRLGPMPLKVVVPVDREGHVPQVGEVWRVDGWISRSQDGTNRFRRRILWVPEAGRARCVKAVRGNDVRANWEAIGEDLSRRAGAGLSWCPDLAALNRAILLGRRNELPKARRQAFVDAGTIHVFAISGLHVMVVAWLLGTTLSSAGLSSRARGLVALPLIWAYVVLTGGRPSAVRAAAMSSFCLVAPAFGRKPDYLSAWALTALGVYGISPERIFDLGCTFSFTVMFGIVLWGRWTRHFRPWFGEGGRWWTWVSGCSVSFVAWVAGVPIAAHAFGRFTPGGLLANVVVLACAQKMVKVGVGGLAASFICLPLAVVLNNATAAFTWVMAFVSERVAELPFSSFPVTPWSMPVCVLWYVGWMLVFLGLGVVLPRKGRASRRWWR